MTDAPSPISRRSWLQRAAGAAAATLVLPPAILRAQESQSAATVPAKTNRFRIAASDWMMLKRQTPGALGRARECGLDGVEVDMGPLGKRPDFENKLRDEKFRTDYLKQAKELHLEISSLAMSAFYGQSLAKHPSAEKFLNDWIDLIPQVGTRVGFLPIILPKEESPEVSVGNVVALMKKVTAKAEQAGVVLGLNTSLDAAGNVKMLDAIGSPAVKIAYNCGEGIDDKRDVYAELKLLGKDRISQVIPTLSDGVHLKDDKRIDVPKLNSRQQDRARDVKYNFGANAEYLKSIFQA
jgi:L-ribulose-5-phosphate 3-epimerase